MGYYDELAKKALETGEAKDITPTWHPLEKVGDTIVGRLMGVSKVEGRTFKGSFNKYLLQTDVGMEETKLGQAADKLYADSMAVGAIYMITRGEDQQLDKSNAMHTYTILEIPETGKGVTT